MTEKQQTGRDTVQFSSCSDAHKLPDGNHSYSSKELFRGAQEIAIQHQGASYRLRITRTGGLILNK